MTWGAVVAGVVGAGASIYNSSRSGPSAPPPQALPGPSSPGGWQSDQGYGTYDPNTNTYRQGNYGFDPTGMAQSLPAQNMWLNFTGQGTSGITDQLDWQIKSLTDKLGQLTNPKAGANKDVDPAKFGLGDWIDPTTGKMGEWTKDPDGIMAGKYGAQGKAIYDAFMRDTKGNYGRDGFWAWLPDASKNLQGKVKEYEDAKRSQGGNQEINQTAVQDIQNQIDYLNKQKLQYTPTLPDGSPNPAYKDPSKMDPFSPFTKDLGATWQGNGNNQNPWTEDWNQLTKDKIAQANLTPDEYMKKYMGDYANPEFEKNAIAEFQKKIGNTAQVGVDEVRAPDLNPDAAGNLESALNWRAARDAQGQQTALRQRLGERGMSAMGELAAFSQGQNLTGQMLQNQTNAAQMGNDLTAKNWGMQSQAAQQNNQARVNAAQLGLQGLNTGFAAGQQGFGNALQRTNLANNLQNNWFQQAQQALANSNNMRAEDRAWDVQDYGMKRDENNSLYGRTNDQWNRLSQANQQAFQNKLQSQAALNGQAGMYTQAQQNNAGNQNNANVANAQMQNSWQMQQAQLDAARQNSQNNAWSGIAQAGLNAMGNYWGNQTGPKRNASGQNDANDVPDWGDY